MSAWLSVLFGDIVVCEYSPMRGFLWCLSLMVFVGSQARVFIYILMSWACRSGSLSFTQ